MVRLGTGEFVYKLVEGWLRPPEGWDMVEVPGVAMDSANRVYVLTRSEHPVVVFDQEGNYLASWGEDSFQRPHGIFIGPDNSVYLVDDFAQTLRKCSPDGRVLMTVGVEGQAAETGFEPDDFLSVKHGGLPFNRPTNVALSPEGDILVTDGYGNSRVHRFSPGGELLCSWGEPGSGPGQFRLVHGICVGQDGIVYVGDRMNSRIQVFGPRGEFIAQWNDAYQPNDLHLDGEGHIFVAEIGYRADLPMPGPVPAPEDSYSRVTVRNLQGEILSKITTTDPRAPGGFLTAHAVRVDSAGDLYVGEVSATRARNQGKNRHDFHILQKFTRV